MPVLVTTESAVATLTLSRPASRNCWGQDFTDELEAHLRRIEQDAAIRCVVLTGDPAGDAFSAGADLKDARTHTLDSADDLFAQLPRWRKFTARVLDEFPKPIIAAVNGYAIGIGCILTYCCDLIVASERAQWRLPQTALGIMPAYGGAVRLARWVGKGQAMRLAMGFNLSAQEAYRIGLAQWLVPHEQMISQAQQVAIHIASAPAMATQMAKESLVRGLNTPNLEEASWNDVYRFMALGLTSETRERHEQWRNKPRK
jgi:enoyl-CoA hydratase/carnithine racemase